MPRELTHEQKMGFAHEFRDARAVALRDAEAFEDHLFVLERLGSFVCEHNKGLGWFKDALSDIAASSPLATAMSLKHADQHLSFDTLFEQVREARNDAMHQGAVARHLATHAQELALIMEDALMNEARLVQDFMIREPMCAELWQPLGTIRRCMLMNAFSYLPFKAASGRSWKFLSDHTLARFLRVERKERARRLLLSLDDALKEDADFRKACKTAKSVKVDFPLSRVVPLINATPCVVLSKSGRLAGLITAFDVL